MSLKAIFKTYLISFVLSLLISPFLVFAIGFHEFNLITGKN
jgi:hypothetical protein